MHTDLSAHGLECLRTILLAFLRQFVRLVVRLLRIFGDNSCIVMFCLMQRPQQSRSLGGVEQSTRILAAARHRRLDIDYKHKEGDGSLIRELSC